MRRIIILVIGAVAASCSSGPRSTTAGPDAVRAFYVGLAALEVGDDQRAKEELTKATQIAPNEPAAWANLGILQIRQKDFDSAKKNFDRAKELAADNADIHEAVAVLERQRGNFDAAQASLQKAIDIEPNNVKAIYALAEEKERQLDNDSAQQLYEKITRLHPENLEARLATIRLAAKRGDAATMREQFSGITNFYRPPEDGVKLHYHSLASAIERGNAREVATVTSYFRNVLLPDPKFRADVAQLRYSDTTLGEPITRPIVLKVPDSAPAPPDTEIKFETEDAGGRASWRKLVYTSVDEPPVIASASEQTIRVGKKTVPSSVSTLAGFSVVDFDYDFKADVALADAKGFRLYKQDWDFFDKTPQTKLPAAITNGSYAGVWPLDVESDGDLDVVLGRTDGPPVVLQNNSDGTFSTVDAFTEVNGLRKFAAVDFDEDGDADAVLLDANGDMHFYSNERGGSFKRGSPPSSPANAHAFTIADINSDGTLDAVILRRDGSVGSISNQNGTWTTAELLRTEVPLNPTLSCGDLDNNGAVDVIVSGGSSTKIWLGEGHRKFTPLQEITVLTDSVGDIDQDGRLDLIGPNGVSLNRGSKNYKWQIVQPRAAKTTGDQRVNSFGIGGELELRAGLLLQKRLITEPVVHFGLGENMAADVLRVVWQNGYVQAEFDLKPNQTVAAEQRLKGSCPHLFAFDGESFKLVKDAPPWSPALGLKINAQDTFGIIETEEWFKVPGGALQPTKENVYELRITGEYWESFYLDKYSLLVVDHPENTEVFTDERFSVPPPRLEVFATGALRDFAAARNDRSEDVSAIVSTIDEKYLDGFERGTFQGVAKDHYVELDLPADAPIDKRIAIIADGWVHPTDASINVQLGQSGHEKPRSLSLEVRRSDGTWKVAKENLGFPAGKMKTMIIELPVGTRAARLRTNMEVFWDKLAWAAYETGHKNRVTRLELSASDLRYRGFSVIEKKDDSSPEIPDYDRILTTTQRWRAMEGYFTRYGDVLELLTRSDDRYVLASPGDELILKFPALPPPASGYKRDFVLIGDGWIKDGDLNSVFSRTLLPLPTHATNDYSKPPTTLENDPVYRKNKADWINFHTRYVSPDSFRNALR